MRILDTRCSHFLTIIAGVDLHFRHESELPVCRTRGLNPGCRGANFVNNLGMDSSFHIREMLVLTTTQCKTDPLITKAPPLFKSYCHKKRNLFIVKLFSK